MPKGIYRQAHIPWKRDICCEQIYQFQELYTYTNTMQLIILYINKFHIYEAIPSIK